MDLSRRDKFILFKADAPSPELIPASELVSVTVIILSCSYNDKEFVRVGYYVNNEYDTEELRENPPAKVAIDHVVRNILAENLELLDLILFGIMKKVLMNILLNNQKMRKKKREEEGEEEEEEKKKKTMMTMKISMM